MVSLTADYALRALLVLAGTEHGRIMRSDEIADATGAPRNYMAKVLNAVAKAGLISSTRGPSGGFVLAAPAGAITLGRIIDLFDQDPPNLRCMLGNGPCDPSHPCRAHDAWQAVTRARRAPLLDTTLEDLLAGHVAEPLHTTSEDPIHVS